VIPKTYLYTGQQNDDANTRCTSLVSHSNKNVEVQINLFLCSLRTSPRTCRVWQIQFHIKLNSSTRWKRVFNFWPRRNYLREKSKVRTKRMGRPYSRSTRGDEKENLCPRRRQNSDPSAYSPLTVLRIHTLQTLIMRYLLRLRAYRAAAVATDCKLFYYY
jgi:hypothetical protein